MQITNQEFDMDPKTFTLEGMFAMKLHNHVEDVNKVTNMATKELTIETEIKKLGEVWKAQTFEVHKYMKVRNVSPEGHNCVFLIGNLTKEVVPRELSTVDTC